MNNSTDKHKLVYRKNPKTNYYEVGECYEPRQTGMWCDRVLCHGMKDAECCVKIIEFMSQEGEKHA